MISHNPDWLKLALLEASKEQTARIMAEEIESAQRRVEERMKAMVDQLALSILAHYEFSRDERYITIRVDTRALTPPTP